MPRKNNDQAVGLFNWIHRYFYELGVSPSFSKSMQLLLKLNPRETQSGYHTRLTRDTLTSAQYIFSSQHGLLPYFENTLYYILADKNDGNFDELYTILSDSLSLIKNPKNGYCIPEKVSDVDKIVLDSLIDYIQKKEPGIDTNSKTFFAKHLYSILHFFTIGYCPPTNTDDIFNLSHYRKELMEKVVIPNGVSTKPGIYQLMRLADEGNPLAMYECSGLFYYAIACPVPNYQIAYNYCEKAAKAEPVPAPVALWDYGYTLYNYKKKGNELEEAHITQLENMTFEERVRLAITYEKKASACGIVAAYNVLGNIAADSAVPDNIKEEYNLQDAESLWRIAAEKDYVFALCNMGKLYKQKSEKEKDPDKKKEFFELYLDYLKRAGDQYGGWANNVLGLEYYKMNKPKEAYERFFLAKKTNFEWAYYNLLEKYHLPAYTDGEKFSYLDEFTTVEELVKGCLTCRNEEVIEKTRLLLKDYPELT